MEYKNYSIAIPGQIDSVNIEKIAHFLVFKIEDIDLTIKWDLKVFFYKQYFS